MTILSLTTIVRPLKHLVEATHLQGIDKIGKVYLILCLGLFPIFENINTSSLILPTQEVYIKEHITSTKREISIFKEGITAPKVQKAKLPSVIFPVGLTRERQEYMYKEGRCYVKSEYQDITCPPLN